MVTILAHRRNGDVTRTPPVTPAPSAQLKAIRMGRHRRFDYSIG